MDGGIYEDDIVWNSVDYLGEPYLIEDDLDILFMDVPDYYTAPDYNYHPIITKRNYTGDILWQHTFSKDTFDTNGDLNEAILLEDGYLIEMHQDYDIWADSIDDFITDYVSTYTKLDFSGNIVYHLSDTGYMANHILPKTGGGFYVVGALSTLLNTDEEPYGLVMLEKDEDGNTVWLNSTDTINGVIWTDVQQRTDGGFDLLGVGSSILSGSEEKVELYRLDAGGNLLDKNIIAYSDEYGIGNMVKCADGNYAMAGRYNYGLPNIDHYSVLIKTDDYGNIAKTEISGRVFGDVNSNGIYDAGDKPKKDKIITVDDKPYYGTTDDAGVYRFFAYDTGNYVIRTAIPTYYFQQFPLDDAPHNVMIDSVGMFSDSLHFMIGIADTVYDLRCTVDAYPNRPGYERDVYVMYQNIGTIHSPSVQIILMLDSINTLTGDSDGASLTTDTTIVWNIGTLAPGYSSYVKPKISVESDWTLVGDSVHFVATISPDSLDANPVDNMYAFTAEITSSWDPNIKTAQPAGVSEWGYINPATEEMIYTIHFQNTGNDTAFAVVLIDTLTDELDITSLDMIFATHNYSMQFDYPNVVKWIFNEIILPDSLTNESESKGFVQFKIQLQDGLSEGTQFSNKAFIYFDYNPAVITASVYTTLQVFVPQLINSVQPNQLHIYPNPTSDALIIELKEITSLLIFDMQGNIVKSLSDLSSGKQLINVNDLNAGTYIIQSLNNDVLSSAVFIISR